MKAAILALPLVLASCATGPVMIPMEPAVERTVSRVVERHDAYVQADQSLSESERGNALEESAGVQALASLKEVSASVIAPVLVPVMDRHDAYVRADTELDLLASSIFLGDTSRLRSLLAAVAELSLGL